MPVIKKNETLADYVTREIGSVAALFYLANKNGISITEDVAAGLDLVFDENETVVLLKENKAVAVPEYLPEVEAQTLKKHQNNFDFVCQHAGTMEFIFQLAILNGISITKIPEPGEKLQVQTIDEKTVALFNSTGLMIASESEDNGSGPIQLPGGIGYMKIESTFIVS